MENNNNNYINEPWFQKYNPKQHPNKKKVGRPPDDPTLKAVKMLTKRELAEVGSLILKGNVIDILALVQDKERLKKVSAMHAVIASIVAKIIQKGDMVAFDKLLDRIVGKNSADEMAPLNLPRVVITLPSNQREALDK